MAAALHAGPEHPLQLEERGRLVLELGVHPMDSGVGQEDHPPC